MGEPKSIEETRAAVRTLQIIVCALALGVTTYFCYVLTQKREIDDGINLSYFAIGFAVIAGILSIIIPRLVAKGQVKQIASGTFTMDHKSVQLPTTDEGKLAAVYQTTTIIGCALLEGAGFFNTFVYSTEGQIANAAIAVLVVLGVLFHFPTVARITDWIDQKKYDLEMERKSMPLEE